MRKKEINLIEKKTMNILLYPILGMALSGLIFGELAHSNAIVLDGTFSLVLFFSLLVAKLIAKIAGKPRDDLFPQGRSMFEVLYRLFKSLILLVIISVGFFEAITTLFSYFVLDTVPEAYDHFWGNIYYVFKFVFFAIAFFVVSRSYSKTRKKSKLLKLEQLSVLTDGLITFAIWFGFTFLALIPAIEEISDSVILLLMSIFLFFVIFKEFKEELLLISGKRNNIDAENKYKMLFKIDPIVRKIDILQIIITDNGKLTTVSMTAKFDQKLYSYELAEIQHEVKKIMHLEYGDIFLQTYWE